MGLEHNHPYNLRYLEPEEFSPDGYQRKDWDVVDYQLCKMDGIHLPLRGPITWDGTSKFIAFVGAAQTFGRYCAHPFPNLIGDKLNLSLINLGHAGAGPALFIRKPCLNLLSSAQVVVVQVMSGRSVGTTLLDNPQANGLLRRRDLPNDPLSLWHVAWDKALRDYGSEFISYLVEETRATYVAQMRMLLRAIKAPKILLWFAKRKPEYVDDYSHFDGFFFGFPHMVNDKVVAELRPFCDQFVEVVSRRGAPQKLVNRFDGSFYRVSSESEERQSLDNYYPSPEMHEDAAEALCPVVKELFYRNR